MDSEIKKLLSDNLLETPSRDFADQTMQKICEAQKRRPVKKNIGRWFILPPLVATVAMAFFLVVFWQGGSKGDISWAEVLERIEQARTVTAIRYVNTYDDGNGGRLIDRGKVYFKDPGFSRIESHLTIPDNSFGKPKEPDFESERIWICRSTHDSSDALWLDPESKSAVVSHTSRIDSSKPTSLNVAADTLSCLKSITADKAKNIGDRILDGKSFVVFEADVPVPDQFFGNSMGGVVMEGRIQVWVGREDAMPHYFEIEADSDYSELHTHLEYSDIRWDIPLEDSLFDLTVPEGWDVTTHEGEVELIEYTDTGFAPGITLQLELAGRESLDVAGEVTGVVRVEHTYAFDSDDNYIGQLTIDLAPETARYLHDYEDANPDEPIIVHFNGQLNVKASFSPLNATHLQFNLAALNLSLEDLETGYFKCAELPVNQSHTGDELSGYQRRFELRLASNEKVDGWERVSNFEGPEAIWVSPEVVIIRKNDVSGAGTLVMGDEYCVDFYLSDIGALKYTRLTEAHSGEMVAIIIDGQVNNIAPLRERSTGVNVTMRGFSTYRRASDFAQAILERENSR